MYFRLTFFFCMMLVMVVSAYPSEQPDLRARRDVMETMKNAWNEVKKTFSDAGDAVVHVFQPKPRTVLDDMTDQVKKITK